MAALISLLALAAGLAGDAWGLSAAAVKVDITPDPGRQRVYLSGFGATGRRAQGVHDPLYARLLVLREGPRTLALAGLDLLGFYREDVDELRRLAGFAGPDRYLLVAATHDHSGPDTMGLWGPLPGVSGKDAAYQRRVKERVAAALRDLESRLQEVSVTGWHGDLDPRGLCRDNRDPVVIDPDLAALSFKDRRGRSVATVVNWSCHPEVLGPRNRQLTADYPGYLCDRVEKETGGACLFLNGPIGGLLTPETVPGRGGFAEARRIGTTVAAAALRGLATAQTKPGRPILAFRSRTVLVPVENSRFLIFLPALTFGHRLCDACGRPMPRWKAYWLAIQHLFGRLRPEARPRVETEVCVVDVGPARLLGMPAEVFPELVIGGYDGRFRGDHPLLKPDNPNPPDLKKAPRGPYLKELMSAAPPTHIPLFAGLANDEIGYLVPDYDFKVQDSLLMLRRPPGDHYEETNSIGPSATHILLKEARRLLLEDAPMPSRLPEAELHRPAR